MLREDPAPARKLRDNALYFRNAIAETGFTNPHGTHPIVPVIVGTRRRRSPWARRSSRGIYVTGFGYPVVPNGQARLRCQVSAAHEKKDLARPVEAFRKVGKQFGIV